MNNKLITTNGIWYKIKNFLKKVFTKNNSYTNNIQNQKLKIENELTTNNLKEGFEEEKRKKELAEKLLYGEIGPSELEDSEVDEMTDYFKKDIENIDNELLRIKQHIIAMQKELKQS